MNRVVFNEDALRKEIIKIWGNAGAHIEVFDMMLDKIRSLEEIKPCCNCDDCEYNKHCSGGL